MRVIVVGLGVQGNKRKYFSGKDFIASVDPLNINANYRTIEEVPLDSYDAVLACTPDEPKYKIIKYCLENKKHVLVEKPLWAIDDKQLEELELLAIKNKVVCYTAYNHRFEPHFLKMRSLIK